MKKILLLCFIFSITIVNAQKNIGVNINTGFPIIDIGKSFDFGNFYFESSIQKPVFKNIFLGIGLNYSNIDVRATNNLLTYDRNTFKYFILLGNSFITKKSAIDFSPQMKIGYSFYNYSLNEFKTKKQSGNGFYAAAGLVVKYKLTYKLFINTHVFYNIIFNQYQNNIDFPIPAIFITTQDKHIKDFNAGIGVTFKLY